MPTSMLCIAYITAYDNSQPRHQKRLYTHKFKIIINAHDRAPITPVYIVILFVELLKQNKKNFESRITFPHLLHYFIHVLTYFRN